MAFAVYESKQVRLKTRSQKLSTVSIEYVGHVPFSNDKFVQKTTFFTLFYHCCGSKNVYYCAETNQFDPNHFPFRPSVFQKNPCIFVMFMSSSLYTSYALMLNKNVEF